MNSDHLFFTTKTESSISYRLEYFITITMLIRYYIEYVVLHRLIQVVQFLV